MISANIIIEAIILKSELKKNNYFQLNIFIFILISSRYSYNLQKIKGATTTKIT